jgi:hypothetical protein
MKVGQFFFNLAGSKDSITFDTWMKRVIFGKDNISEADWARGFDLVQQAANRLGWDADQTQAALWASGLVEAGKKPTDFTTELRSRAAEIIEIRRRSGQLTDEEADALLADAERRAGGDRPGARGGDEGAAGRGRPAGRDGEAEPAPRVGEDPPGYRPQKPPAEPNEGTEPVQREPTEASKGRIRPGISVSTTGVPRFKFATKQYGPPLREFFEFMIENQPAAIEHTRRGAMTVAQIRELAAKWGMTVEQYRKMRQGIILPAEGEVQLANLINQAYRMSEDFVALGANATRDGRVEEAAEFERRAAQALHNAGMLTTRYFAAGSEAGRALRIRKEGLLTTDKLTEQAMRTIMDEQKLSQQAQEVLLKRVHDAKGDRGEILKALREAYIPTWWDKIMEYRTAVLLSSPVTLGRNVFGNTIALATRELEVVGGVPVDMLYGVLARGEKLGSDPSLGRRSPLEIGADMVGLGMGLKEGARLALKAFRDEDFAITRGRVGEEAVQDQARGRVPPGHAPHHQRGDHRAVSDQGGAAPRDRGAAGRAAESEGVHPETGRHRDEGRGDRRPVGGQRARVHLPGADVTVPEGARPAALPGGAGRPCLPVRDALLRNPDEHRALQHPPLTAHLLPEPAQQGAALLGRPHPGGGRGHAHADRSSCLRPGHAAGERGLHHRRWPRRPCGPAPA